MLKSTIYLPDVNVWLALATRRHVHFAHCSKWIDSLTEEGLAFCRVTQMGLLRLLTNSSVMGPDILAASDAWKVYHSFLSDQRVDFAPEPFELEERWKELTSQKHPVTKIWTGAYLVAFARAASMRMVTLERALQSLAPDALVLPLR